MFVLALILIFIGYLLFNALRFRPKKEKKREAKQIVFDKEAAVSNLRELVKCKTVSYYDSSLEDNKEFNKLIRTLPKLYPHVAEKLELKKFKGNRALLYCWKGKEEGPASVYMAHFDVVPVEEELWTKPAFDGVVEDEIMYGRGCLDTKLTVNGILMAAETLLSKGFKPKHDIYFAFSGQEEIAGEGAITIAKYLKKKGVEFSMILDEGGAVVNGVFPGVKRDCGLVGIGEKGMLDVELSVKNSGGHASAPDPHTPIGILAEAIRKVENHPLPYDISEPVEKMFDTLGRHSSFLYRIIFANINLFKPVLDLLCKKKGGELNALIRTTCAFTQMSGSKAPNVIPPKASVVANIRISPNNTVESVIEYLQKTIDDERIEIRILDGNNPSTISLSDSDAFANIKQSIEDTWNGALVSPYLMIQCSDARRYSGISDKVYRFSAMDVTAEERKTIHGNDERVRISTVYKTVEFFIRMMSLN